MTSTLRDEHAEPSGSAKPRNELDRYAPSVVVIASSDALYPLHLQTGHEIIYLEHGRGIAYAGGHACRMLPGDLLFISHGVTHGFVFEPGARCVLAGIGCSLMPQFTDFIEDLGLPFFLASNALADEQIERAIGHLLTRPAAFKSGIKLMSEFSMLLDALATRFVHAEQLPQRRPDDFVDRFARAAYIEVDESNPSLDRVASELGVSRSYASRQFKSTLGLSLPAYAAVARVDATRRLLVQTTTPIGDVARLCHYSSMRTFDRQFSQIAGMTASAYREAFAPSQVVNYDLPGHRTELEAFFERLVASCPAIPRC